MPNLLPYLAATLVSSVSAAILASIGLEVLGLGPIELADAGHDAVLGEFQRGDDQWLVVVVGAADRDHRDGVPRVVLCDRGAGRDRQSPAAEIGMNGAVLEVRDLRVSYAHPLGAVRAVDGVSFTLAANERFGLAGKSGSGKSTMALAILRMIRPPGRIDGGRVFLDGVELSALDHASMRRLRLAGIALVPQGSMNSLNPVMRIGAQIEDALADHGVALSRAALDVRVGELLSTVGLRPGVAALYPHELSGGMKQRACIAIAICLRPRVIIADEPTSALDVVVQRQVMETLARVQRDLGAAVILVGHDMGLMAQFVDRLGDHVCRAAGGGGADRGDGDGAATSLHAGTDREFALAGAAGAAAGHSGTGSAAARFTARLCVSSALCDGGGAVCAGGTGASAGGFQRVWRCHFAGAVA